jgi:hypothetical protein
MTDAGVRCGSSVAHIFDFRIIAWAPWMIVLGGSWTMCRFPMRRYQLGTELVFFECGWLETQSLKGWAADAEGALLGVSADGYRNERFRGCRSEIERCYVLRGN